MADTEIENYSDLCASYHAAFDQLVKRRKSFGGEEYKSFGLSGGVSNNQKIGMIYQIFATNGRSVFTCTPQIHRRQYIHDSLLCCH